MDHDIEPESPVDREARASVDEVLRLSLTEETRNLVVGANGILVADALHAVSRVISNEIYAQRLTPPRALMHGDGSVDIGKTCLVADAIDLEIARATRLWSPVVGRPVAPHFLCKVLRAFVVRALREQPVLFEHLRLVSDPTEPDLVLELVVPADRVIDPRVRWRSTTIA